MKNGKVTHIDLIQKSCYIYSKSNN